MLVVSFYYISVTAQSQSEMVKIQSDHQGGHEGDDKQVTHSQQQIG